MEHRYRWKWGFVLVGLVCVCVLGFYAIHPKEIVLTFGLFAGSNWDVPSGTGYLIIDDAISRFEQEHPNVKVKYTSGILKSDYSEWFAQQLIEGKEPDVFMILSDDFNTLSSLGAMKDLRHFMKKDDSFHSSDYYDAAFLSGQYQGNQYALPYECVPTMMFVNKTILEKEGIPMPAGNWSLDEFYDICQRITKDTDGNGIIDQFGCYDYNWEDAVISNGAVLFDETGHKSYFSNSKVEQAVRFVKKLNDLNKGYQVTSKEFDMGQVAFRPFLFSDYRTYMPYPWRIKKYSNFEWDCIPMPTGKQEEQNGSQLSTLLMGISSRTKQESLAWEFLKTLTYEEETQCMLFEYSQGASALKTVTESVEIMEILKADTPGNQEFDMALLSNVMEDAVIQPKFLKYDEAMSLADSEISQAIANEKEIRTVLLTLQRKIDKYLNG